MAYATTNPPALHSQAMAGAREWVYSSADASTVVDGNGYFSNGWDLGMREGDTVMVTQTGVTPVVNTIHLVSAASSASGVDVSNALTVTATDSD